MVVVWPSGLDSLVCLPMKVSKVRRVVWPHCDNSAEVLGHFNLEARKDVASPCDLHVSALTQQTLPWNLGVKLVPCRVGKAGVEHRKSN